MAKRNLIWNWFKFNHQILSNLVFYLNGCKKTLGLLIDFDNILLINVFYLKTLYNLAAYILEKHWDYLSTFILIYLKISDYTYLERIIQIDLRFILKAWLFEPYSLNWILNEIFQYFGIVSNKFPFGFVGGFILEILRSCIEGIDQFSLYWLVGFYILNHIFYV